MARTPSPLRYPGGKTALLKTVGSILRENRLDRGRYVEPFAGGGGLALSLLYKGDVGEIHLNDIDPSIAALWRAILMHSADLIDLMKRTPVTMEERAKQREIYLTRSGSDIELGFATLFLNRVNRSGIIRTGGAIGGSEQSGKYLLDCRFNKVDLEARLKRISKYRKRIHFTSMDGGLFLKEIAGKLPERTLIYADPPYYVKGAELYTSSFKKDDHKVFRDHLVEIEKPWILTYDDVPDIRKIYADRRQYGFDLNYSAQTKRIGSELLIVSKGLRIPADLRERQVNEPQYRNGKALAVDFDSASTSERNHFPHTVHGEADLCSLPAVELGMLDVVMPENVHDLPSRRVTLG